MLKAVIFDLDGVVVDTVKLHYAAWKKMFDEYGVYFDFEIYKQKVDGIVRNDGARNVLSHLKENQIVEAASKKEKYFLEKISSQGIDIYDDAIVLIKKLKKENVKIGVISSSKSCKMILEKIDLLKDIDTVVSGKDIKNGKPHPEIFLKAVKNMDLKSQECIGIEDAILGIDAVKNAGMKAIGIDRYNDPARLNKADIVVSDLSKITVEQMRQLI
ncbi:MAG: beta-phosphoglucomutase family hydrolase [Candidatus Omnitrophica bacterium]|nr:beta-phosphoglucomutase family hydrolase [Candidatus Omnitrophota bacterium]